MHDKFDMVSFACNNYMLHVFILGCIFLPCRLFPDDVTELGAELNGLIENLEGKFHISHSIKGMAR